MLKKMTVTFTILVLIVLQGNVVLADSYFNKENVNKGVLEVNYSSNKKTKLMVEHNGQKYYYDVLKAKETFPLQMGNGKYKVTLLEQVEGKKYSVKAKDDFSVNLEKKNEVFLNPVQGMKWNPNDEVATLAKKLTAGINNDEEKVEVIYNYVVKNIKYDDEKYATLSKNYVPNGEEILRNKKGLCYDFASLFGSMLRSVNVPVKLVKGYKSDISVYHAWNQVYIDNQWVTIDTTYDAGLYEGNIKPEMIKNESSYKITKVY